MNRHVTFWYGLANRDQNCFADASGHVFDFGIKDVQEIAARTFTRERLGEFRAVPIPSTGRNCDWIDEP